MIYMEQTSQQELADCPVSVMEEYCLSWISYYDFADWLHVTVMLNFQEQLQLKSNFSN